MCSITMSAITGDRLDPIGIPEICLYVLPWDWKYVVFKQKVTPLSMSSLESLSDYK